MDKTFSPFTFLGIEKAPSDRFGVYGIWYRGRCIYVGLAQKQSIRERLTNHKIGASNIKLKHYIQAFNEELSFCFEIYEPHEAITREREYINKLQPITNIIRYKEK